MSGYADPGDERIAKVGVALYTWPEMIAWLAEHLPEGTRSGRLKAELIVDRAILDTLPVAPMTWVNPLHEAVYRSSVRVLGAPMAQLGLTAIDPGGVFLE